MFNPRTNRFRQIVCCAVATWLGVANPLHAAPTAQFVPAFPTLRFDRPVYITHPNDGTDRLVVVEQAGRVLWFDPTQQNPELHTLLDIRSRVRRRGDEQGLLGIAFAPDFAASGRIYTHYSAKRSPRRNTLSRFTVNPRSLTPIPNTEQVLLQIPQPYANHNGGMIAFGPDGYLYVALGDGGAGGDPHGHGQNTSTLLGSILRIDVNTSDAQYRIPSDNPFAQDGTAKPEIWAYGLRNPWRFSFDRATGQLWAGDVGQVKWEEVDIIVRGGNYGWNAREGNHPYKPQRQTSRFINPIVEHARQEARSITGGYVYRGDKIPALQGAYIYGDFMTGLIWSLRYDGKTVTDHTFISRVPAVSSFGEDRDGELFITSLDGQIFQLIASTPPSPTE